jgi:hypothetical protein
MWSVSKKLFRVHSRPFAVNPSGSLASAFQKAAGEVK